MAPQPGTAVVEVRGDLTIAPPNSVQRNYILIKGITHRLPVPVNAWWRIATSRAARSFAISLQAKMSAMTRAAESGNDSRFMRDRLQDTTADAPGGRQQVRIFRRGYRSLTGNIDFGD